MEMPIFAELIFVAETRFGKLMVSECIVILCLDSAVGFGFMLI